MSAEILIRKAGRRDLAVIVRHRRRMFAEMGFSNPRMLSAIARNSRKLLESWLRKGLYHGWLAETREGKIIGGGGVGITDWPPNPHSVRTQRATVFNVYVEPRFRRQGLARRLMKIMIEWCREQGFGVVTLHASSAGRSLYESMGFKPTSEMRLKLGSRASSHKSRRTKRR